MDSQALKYDSRSIYVDNRCNYNFSAFDDVKHKYTTGKIGRIEFLEQSFKIARARNERSISYVPYMLDVEHIKRWLDEQK